MFLELFDYLKKQNFELVDGDDFESAIYKYPLGDFVVSTDAITDTEEFTKKMQFKQIKSIDADGSGLFEWEGHKFILLNTYGDEDTVDSRLKLSKDEVFFYTPMILVGNKWEVGDICYNFETKKLELYNYGSGEIPVEIKVDKIAGKRAFYLDLANNRISFRYARSEYGKVPDKFQHKEALDWASGPRVVVPFKNK